jgi:hypothetical protein
MISDEHIQKLREAGLRTVERLKKGGVIPQVNARAPSAKLPTPNFDPTNPVFDNDLPNSFKESFGSPAWLEREVEVLQDDLDWALTKVKTLMKEVEEIREAMSRQHNAMLRMGAAIAKLSK